MPTNPPTHAPTHSGPIQVLVIEPSGVTSPVPLPNYAALKIQPKKIMAKNQKEMGYGGCVDPHFDPHFGIRPFGRPCF